MPAERTVKDRMRAERRERNDRKDMVMVGGRFGWWRAGFLVGGRPSLCYLLFDKVIACFLCLDLSFIGNITKHRK